MKIKDVYNVYRVTRFGHTLVDEYDYYEDAFTYIKHNIHLYKKGTRFKIEKEWVVK